VAKITTFILTSVFLLGIIFPGGNVFGVQKLNIDPKENQPAQVRQPITVISAVPSQKIISDITSHNYLATACNAQAAASGDLVQDAGLINLNQPANCFTLNISRQTYSYAQLSVQPLNTPHPNVTVLNHSPSISSGNLSNAPVKQQTPIMPVVSFGMALAFAFDFRKNLRRSLNNQASRITSSLTLQQLRIMRC
jgi:hypothetical protein